MAERTELRGERAGTRPAVATRWALAGSATVLVVMSPATMIAAIDDDLLVVYAELV